MWAILWCFFITLIFWLKIWKCSLCSHDLNSTESTHDSKTLKWCSLKNIWIWQQSGYEETLICVISTYLATALYWASMWSLGFLPLVFSSVIFLNGNQSQVISCLWTSQKGFIYNHILHLVTPNGVCVLLYDYKRF